MPPHPTSRLRRVTRRTAKWTCTILAGVMVIAWIGSRWQGIHGEIAMGPYALTTRTGWGSTFGAFIHDQEMVDAFYSRNRFAWMPPESNDGIGSLPTWRWTPKLESMGPRATAYCLPLWIPTLLFALPAAWMWRTDLRRRKANRIGLCAKCGYSLLGTPATSPCPECGTARA